MRRGTLGHDPGDASPSHVVVLTSAKEPGRLRRRRAEEGPAWASRATVIDVATPHSAEEAQAWLKAAGETELEDGLAVLNAMLFAHRLAAAQPQAGPVMRHPALAARVGIGAGEEVADGRHTEVRELPWTAPRRPRRRMLTPEGRLAAILTGRDQPLVCEELTLRARDDLDSGRARHAALQLLVALDAAIAELAGDPAAGERVAELRTFREPVGAAAQTALGTELDEDQRAAVAAALGRVEAALRARAAAAR